MNRHSAKSPIAALVVSAAALLTGTQVWATPQTWTGATGGTWSTPGNWSNDTVPVSADDLTILGPGNAAGALTIDLTAASAADSLAFTDTSAVSLSNTGTVETLTIAAAGTSTGITTGTGGVTIADNIALGSSQSWSVGTGGLAVNNVISGATLGLTKTGAGTLTLGAANTFSGGLTLSSGTVVLNSATAAGTGTITINGGTLQIQTAGGAVGNYTNAMIWNSSFGLVGTTKSDGFTGSITLGASGITVTGAGTFGTKIPVIMGAIGDNSNNYGLTIAGTVILGGANTYGGATTINSASTLYLGASVSGGSNGAGTTGSLAAAGTIVDNGTLNFDRTNTITQGTDFSSSAITGTGSVAQIGGGTLNLTTANTYSGATTVTSGTLLLTNSNTSVSATGSGTLTVNANTTLAGTGSSIGTKFNIAGTGTTTAGRANILVGMTSATDTNTTTSLTLKGSAASSISNANLTFNIDTASTNSTSLNVGSTAITFGSPTQSTTLSLNLQGTSIIPGNTAYVLIAGTTTGGVDQYTGLSLGSSSGTLATGLTTLISNSGVGGSGDLTLALTGLANTNYGANSYLFLYQNSTTGVDDIEVEMVPEPGTWALMLGGLGALVFWQRRKRNN